MKPKLGSRSRQKNLHQLNKGQSTSYCKNGIDGKLLSVILIKMS